MIPGLFPKKSSMIPGFSPKKSSIREDLDVIVGSVLDLPMVPEVLELHDVSLGNLDPPRHPEDSRC